MALQQSIQRFLIVRRIFANRRVRTAAGFDPENPVLRKRATLVRNSASSLVKISFVTTARLYRSRSFKQRASTNAVFPDADDRNMARLRCRHSTTATQLFVFSVHRNKRADGLCRHKGMGAGDVAARQPSSVARC